MSIATAKAAHGLVFVLDKKKKKKKSFNREIVAIRRLITGAYHPGYTDIYAFIREFNYKEM